MSSSVFYANFMMENLYTDTSFMTLKCHLLFTFDCCKIFQESLKKDLFNKPVRGSCCRC